MNLIPAKAIAREAVHALEPWCERIEIGGSIRRGRPEVKDVEIICIPKKTPVDLFGSEMEPCPQFVDQVNQWPALKGKATGRYTQRVLPGWINLDLFMARPENWGLILAIRTGSAEYSHKYLAARWSKLGYWSEGGVLHRRETEFSEGSRTFEVVTVEIREEKELFDLLGLPWVEPNQREVGVFG